MVREGRDERSSSMHTTHNTLSPVSRCLSFFKMAKGIRQQKSGKFISWYRHAKKMFHCGTFDTEEDARLARVKALVEIKGEAAPEDVRSIFEKNACKIQSIRRRSRGTTGIRGVCIKRRPGKAIAYECKIKVGGKNETFGVYNDIEEAAAKAKEVLEWRTNKCIGDKPSHRYLS